MFLSLLYSPISSARLHMANVDGWDALGMYRIEDGALTLLFGWLSDFVAETFQVERRSPSPAVMVELDETGVPVSLDLCLCKVG